MYNKKVLQKIMSIIVIFIVIFSLSLYSFAVENTTDGNITDENTTSDSNSVTPMTLKEQQEQVKQQLAQANDELTYVEGELSTKMLNIQKIEDQISEYSKKVDEANSKYNELKAEVDKSESELSSAKEKYDKRYKLLQQRLVALYRRGNGRYLDVILGSKSVMELFSNYYIIESIVNYDSKEIKELYDEKQRIEKD